VSARGIFVVAAVFGFLGVLTGAFGAHALKAKLSQEMVHVFEVGVRYQMYHAFALIASAWALTHFHPGLAQTAARLFVAGTVVFSGSLYVLALTGVKAWGAVTPIGGLLLLAGWASLALSGFLKG